MGRNKEEDEESSDYSQDEKQGQKAEIRKPKIERIDKFKNLKKIVINVSMTQYSVVSDVAEQLNWKVQYSNEAGDWDVFWTDFGIDPDVLIKMHLFQKINHYPGIHTIARKNLLGMHLMSLRNHFPTQYDFFPLTWMLPLQYADFRNYFQSKPKGKCRTYIVKPEADCQGRGIFLTRKMEDLENGKHYVVQRYLARPYLLDGLKFDLRIYVLLCGTNPLRLYMFHEGLARLATQQYIQPCNSNLDKQYMHLTNYAINKHNPKFVFNNSSNNMAIGHKRSLTAVFKQLAQRGMDVTELKAKINDLAVKTIICGLPLMGHQYKCSQPEDYSGNMCFHILGLDIMLNSKGQPIMLQVNHTPSFTTDTPLDYKIKYALIRDSLKLMNINVSNKNQLYNKAKDINKQRLLTGKRHIFEGQEREQTIIQAQKARDQYEDRHLGGFTRIFPIKDQQAMQKYNTIIERANKTYVEENGSVRMKMLDKEGKKLIREAFKQRKKQKEAQKIEKQTTSEPPLECPSPLTPARTNHTEHYITHRNPSLTIEQHQDQSCQYVHPVVRSEQVIPSPTVHKLSQKEYPMAQSTIKVRRIEPQNPTRIQTNNKESRLSNSKMTPQHTRKTYSKEPTRPAPSYLYQHNLTPSQPGRQHSNIIGKHQQKRHNTRGQESQLPNLIQQPLSHQRTPLQHREDRSTGHTVHSEMKGRKIYDHIAEDIRTMITNKNGSGGYVMPRLINLSIDQRAQHSPCVVPQRKIQPNLFIVAPQLNE